MDCQLVSERQPEKRTGSGGESCSAPRFAYSKRFREAFPYYLAMGMSAQEFWEGDCELVVGYRKAAELKADMENERAWLAGRYIYDALLMVAPMYHPFAKKGTKPVPYPAAPYGMEAPAVEEKKTTERKSDANAQALFEMWAINWNKHYEDTRSEGTVGNPQ